MVGIWHRLRKLFGIDYVEFNTSYSDGIVEGRLQWNSDDGTLEVGLPGGNVVLQIGQEHLVKVTNKTGADIADGKLVYTSGSQGNKPTIALAKADNPLTALTFLGMTTEPIANNSSGYVCIYGLVRGLNTSTYTAGQIIYLSETTAGEMTGTRPGADYYTVGIGVVLNDHATEGIVGVLPRFYPDAQRVSGVLTVFDDLSIPATQLKNGATLKPDFDYTNNGLLFPQNDATEIVYSVVQMSHAKKLDTDIRPHLHYIQSSSTQPTFKMDYRYYNNGDAIPGSWTTISTADGDKGIFPYTSGSIMQLAEFPHVTPPSPENISANLDVRIYRDDNDVTGDVLVKYFDLHYEINALGSRLEYVK